MLLVHLKKSTETKENFPSGKGFHKEAKRAPLSLHLFSMRERQPMWPKGFRKGTGANGSLGMACVTVNHLIPAHDGLDLSFKAVLSEEVDQSDLEYLPLVDSLLLTEHPD